MPRGPRGPIEKPKDRKKVLLRLWTYIYAHKWMALGAVLLTVASNLLARRTSPRCSSTAG